MSNVSDSETTRAANFIKKGIEIARDRVREERIGGKWLTLIGQNTFIACASGFLLIGAIGDTRQAYYLLRKELPGTRFFEDYRDAISKLTGLSKKLVTQISRAHFQGKLSAKTIVEKLKTNPEKFLATAY